MATCRYIFNEIFNTLTCIYIFRVPVIKRLLYNFTCMGSPTWLDNEMKKMKVKCAQFIWLFYLIKTFCNMLIPILCWVLCNCILAFQGFTVNKIFVILENKAAATKDSQLFTIMPIINGFYSVDSFFFLRWYIFYWSQK